MLKNVVVAVLFFPLLQTVSPTTRQVAITIDDGPVVGEMHDLANFERVSSGLISALQAEQVPATIFINERQLNVPGQRDARVAVLERWLDAGFALGNHTYSHPSLNNVALWQFQDDVVKGEVITRSLLERRGTSLVWFRYPYLHSGLTAETHEGILTFLEQRGYKAAPVTVDYADYAFAGPYRTQLRAGALETAARIKEAYLAQIDAGFDYAEKASVELFGAEVAQILLIHCNELNSISLRESIARIRGRGYRFITLDEAMKDPAYQRPDTFAGPGGSWLSRTATTLGKKISIENARVPEWIRALGGSGASSKRMPDGKQWTTTNLNVATDGSYCYDDAELNCRRYGRLYTWASAHKSCQLLGDGWRLPTDDEWRQLAKHYGGVREDSDDGGKAAYAALLSGGRSGFNALLGGGLVPEEGRYARLEAHGVYWTATASESNPARSLFYNFGRGGSALNRHREGNTQMAISVRCVREWRRWTSPSRTHSSMLRQRPHRRADDPPERRDPTGRIDRDS